MTPRNTGAYDDTPIDTHSRYHATLQRGAASYPLATEALMRADRHRLRRWQQFIDPADLQAIELLLDSLKSASNLMAASKASHAHRLAPLPKRIADDVTMSLEGILSGYLQVASDTMRDIIETELLMRDLALDPSRIPIWVNANDDVLKRNFQPVHMRQRQAAALGIEPKDAPGATDYSAHSKLLHVGVRLFPRSAESGALAGQRVVHVLDSLADIMFHGISALRATQLLAEAIGAIIPSPEHAVSALGSAFEDLNEARAGAMALEKNVLSSLPAGEDWAAMLFESGLLLIMDPAEAQIHLYKTNRTDFRTFHREARGEHAVSFTLESLGTSTAREDSA